MNKNPFLNVTDRNTEMPFFPSTSWTLTQSDLTAGTTSGFKDTFTWIQVFFDAESLTAPAQLVVYSGKPNQDGSPQCNLVRFAYSGEMKPFKGQAIVASGDDVRGDTWTSTPIGDDADTELSQVIVYGSMY